MSVEATVMRGLELEDDPDRVIVGVGEVACALEPVVLITQALGSCVGVALWDPRVHVIGLAHVMLPTQVGSDKGGRLHRFADTAIPDLVERMVDLGAGRRRMIAKLAGGASMFSGESGTETIGDRNVNAVRAMLERAGVPIVASDTGGAHARTIELSPSTGILLIRSYSYGMREI